MTKLIICYIGDRASQFINLSFSSIIDVADKIVFVWGMDDVKTINKVYEWQKKYSDKVVIIESKFDLTDKGMNGKQRNIYLDYLKKHHLGDWCLVLDPDEVINDSSKILSTIKYLETDYVKENPQVKDVVQTFNPHMEHFIYNLGWIDATKEKHYCLGRFFNVNENLFYSEVEHSLIYAKEKYIRQNIDTFTIYHFGYVGNMFDVLWKYKNNKAKTNIHSPEFVEGWRSAHLLGKYPIKPYDIKKLPQFIKDYFYIKDEELNNGK